jgi:hypothetical protein
MSKIIQFPAKANTEPETVIVPADYFGSEKIPLTDLFLILDQIKSEQKSNTESLPK